MWAKGEQRKLFVWAWIDLVKGDLAKVYISGTSQTNQSVVVLRSERIGLSAMKPYTRVDCTTYRFLRSCSFSISVCWGGSVRP